jgi:quercetin dioxygenase-like cupin family protein
MVVSRRMEAPLGTGNAPRQRSGGFMAFIDLNSLPRREVVPGYRAVFVHSTTMTIAYWDVDAGAVMPVHSHPHEQIASVVEGRFELTVAGESKVMDPGTSAVIPSNTPHGGKALTRCRLLDAFHPVREDYQY